MFAQNAPAGVPGETSDATITLTKTVEVYSYEDMTFTIDNYSVVEGDNLEGILKKRGLWPLVNTKTKEAQLLRLVRELNPAIANPDLISPGQNLYLPVARLEPEAPTEDPWDGSSAAVTYEIPQAGQRPATVVVRDGAGGNARRSSVPEVLPEGTWAIRTPGTPADGPLPGSSGSFGSSEATNAPGFEEVSSPVPARETRGRGRGRASARPSRGSGNDGPMEISPEGIAYRTVRVRQGDTLERLLRREGASPDEIYRTYVKITKTLNPDLRSPDLIIAGAVLRIPLPGGGGGHYYDDDDSTLLYARAGGTTVTDASPAGSDRSGNQSGGGSSGGAKPIRAAAKYRVDTRRLPPAPLPTADSQNARTVLSVIFTRLGENVSAKGRRFLPLDEPPHFDVDTATVPIIDLSNGRHIVLDLARTLKPELITRFREKYPDYMVFQPNRGEAMDKALERLWPMCGYHRVYAKDKTFEGGRDVKLSVSSDWLVWPTADDWNKGQPRVINLAPSQDNGTPRPWVDFLGNHGIRVIDLYKDRLLAGTTSGATPVNNFTVIDVESDNPTAFAAALVKSFGFSPRIGVKVDLAAGRIVTGGETVTPGNAPAVFWEAGPQKTVLEYGDLSTEDLNALRSNGFEVISSARDSGSVLKSILAALKIKLGGPLVLNGDSTGGPSLKLTINGQTFDFNDRTYLYTSVALPDNLTGLDPNRNVVVLRHKDLATPPPAAQSRPPAPAESRTNLTNADLDEPGEDYDPNAANVTSEDI
ncbi:MAG: LysM peptidoglycan-binding domain-containing protein [Deltaproteobacteria bacterium]|nr:LysM peptidoglycan-binding domain-containing protein [Deltaproteobacteria bacterium]